MKRFREFLKPPVFEDEQKSHQAYLLNIITLGLLVIPIPYVIYALVASPETASRALIQAGIGEAINIVLFILLRSGYVRAGSILQVGTFWIFFTISAITGIGVQGESYLLGYPLVIVIAGILIGNRAAMVVTALSVTAGLFMVIAQNNNMLNTDVLRPPLLTWVLSLAIFPMGAVLQYLSSRTVNRALQRARENEEKYKLISKVSSDYVFESKINEGDEAETIWLAGALEKMTGYTSEEYMKAGGWYAHIHPDDLYKDNADMQKLLNNQDVLGSEIRTFTKDGEIRWERVFAHPIWDEEENRLAGIIGAVQDITRQKKAEEKLEATLLQQKAILNNIPDMAWLKDLDSRYIAVNEQFLQISGLRREDVIGKTDFDIWEEDFAALYRKDDIEVMNSGLRKTVEETQKDNNGREYWVETTKTPIRNESGEVIGTTGIAREITQRKKTEQSEQIRREMLEKVIQLGTRMTEVSGLKITLEKIWHGIHNDLGFDRPGIFLYNPEHNVMSGTYGTTRHGEIVDETYLHISLNDNSPEATSIIDVIKEGNGLQFTHNYYIEKKLPDGHTMYGVKEHVLVAAWAGDKPVGVISADNLVTEKPISKEQVEALRLFAGYAGLAIENARLHDALQKELQNRQGFIDELGAKNAELERFTYTVSHDLKSPLVTITGFLGYLDLDARAGKFDSFSKDINRIRQAVDKMQALLNDLLELSRIGRIVNDPVEISFGALVRDALSLLDGSIKASHVSIEFVDDGHSVFGDRVRLLEVIQNLVDNAIKFMKSQPVPQVRIGSIKNAENETIFFVQDNGIGIDLQYKDRIFGLFNKLDANTEGTGIGLTLVKRIIEVHGGTIWVESEAGKGTTFYFTIPHPAKNQK